MIWLVKRLLLVIFPACTLMAAALPTIAPRPDPMADYWEAFGFNACKLPCWAGVTLGGTHYSESNDLLKNFLPDEMTIISNAGVWIDVSTHFEGQHLSVQIPVNGDGRLQSYFFTRMLKCAKW